MLDIGDYIIIKDALRIRRMHNEELIEIFKDDKDALAHYQKEAEHCKDLIKKIDTIINNWTEELKEVYVKLYGEHHITD